MKWYEFEYNKPYHTMSMQQKLRYEVYNNSELEEFLDIEYNYLSGMEVDEWSLA